jgi:hypothetical protein
VHIKTFFFDMGKNTFAKIKNKTFNAYEQKLSIQFFCTGSKTFEIKVTSQKFLIPNVTWLT